MQTNQKRTRVAILISSKIDFKIKIGISKKEGQYVILKRVKHSRIYNIPSSALVSWERKKKLESTIF